MATNILLNNPYRILGVFSNSPKKDVLSNLNKMKAFLKVGKTVSFPLDLPQVLPPIDRSEESISFAQASIELPMDQIKHTLFWFMKVTPLDEVAFNHLLSGGIAQAKEIWNKKECVSSLLNLMTCAMIEGDMESLAVNADILFQNYYQEFCRVVNETIRLTSSQLTDLFVDLLKQDGSYDLSKLMQVPGTSAEWKKIIGSGLVEHIIDSILLAISEANSVTGPSANYLAGEKLMNTTKGLLSQLKGILGTSDMQYQIIADKLATAILQCGINYFKETEDDDGPRRALNLQGYALSIAIGQSVVDRCKENVDILKKIWPEYSVRKQLHYLNILIENFHQPKSTSKSLTDDIPNKVLVTPINLFDNSDPFHSFIQAIQEINQFIAKCEPELDTIQKKLGCNNDIYLNVSSSIVSLSTNRLVAEFNNFQEKNQKGPYGMMMLSLDDPVSIQKKKTNLLHAVKVGIETLKKIGNLHMDSKVRQHYDTNYKSLNNMLSSLSPKPTPQPSEGCYIATMAYGDYDHPQVMVLRQFRDSYLSKRDWGKKFINFYYANSPRWIETLKDHKRINSLIRKFLDSFVYFWKKTSLYE